MTNYGVLGTGVVGRTFAAKLSELGHEVRMGTRDVDAAKTSRPPRTGPTSPRLPSGLRNTPPISPHSPR